MAEINIIERPIVPVNPAPTRVLQKDKYTLYAPTASNSQAGIAAFDVGDFVVRNGVVSINSLYDAKHIRRINADDAIPDDIVYEGIDGVKTPGCLYYNYGNDVSIVTNGVDYGTVSKRGELFVTASPTGNTYTQTEVFYTDGEVFARALEIEYNADEGMYVVKSIGTFKSANTGLAGLQYSGIVQYNYEEGLFIEQTRLNVGSVDSTRFNRTPVIGDKFMYVAQDNDDSYLVTGTVIELEPAVAITVNGIIQLNQTSVHHASTADVAESAKDYIEGGTIDTKIREVEESITTEVAEINATTGSKITISVDPGNFVIAVSLYNKNDEVISSNEIDLPIESLVTNAEVIDDTTLRLYLQNNTYFDVDLSKLLKGVVLNSRTINGYRLDADITITADNVGAYTKDDVDELVNMLQEEIENISDMKYPIATTVSPGIVKPDGITVTIDEDGTIHVTAEASVDIATEELPGIVKPDGETIVVDEDGTIHATAVPTEIATTEDVGVVKPDGATIVIAEDGTISATMTPASVATTENAGIVKPDGETVTVDVDGTIHAVQPEVPEVYVSSFNGRSGDVTPHQDDYAEFYADKNTVDTMSGEIEALGERVTTAESTIAENGADIESLGAKITNIEADIADIRLFKFPNAIIHGEPLINNGQISGFSAANYLSLPSVFNLEGRGFEFAWTFMTGANITSAQNILGSNYCMALLIENGLLKFRVSSNGTGWDIADNDSTLVVTPNTLYYVKIVYDKLVYKLQYSLDDTEFITCLSVVDTRSPYPAQIRVGIGNNGFSPFGGIVNLNNCYLKVNNSIVWQGMDDAGLTTRLATDLENIDQAGIDKIKEIVGDIPETAIPDPEVKEAGNFLVYNGTVWEAKGIELVATLSANTTEVTFTSDKITEDSTIDFYTDTFGVSPVNAVVSTGTLTLEFLVQENDVIVKVVVK